jgi:hemolysin III
VTAAHSKITADLHRRVWPDRPGPLRAEAEFPNYTPAERRVDAIVHMIGLALALAGCIALAVTALPGADLARLVGLGLYAVGLLAMLGCSALYNLTREEALKRLFRRLDHAAIFAMIAGTYTPFALLAIGGAWGMGLLVLVWTVAVGGTVIELFALRRHDRLSVTAYLLLGWSILPALGPLSAAVTPSGIALLAVGGVLYSIGTIFHMWSSLLHQNAIWHGFVLAGAACHYTAVLREVAAA